MRVFKSLSLSIPYVLALGGAWGLSTFPSPPSAQATTVQPLSNTCAPLLSALAQARPDAESLSGLSARLKDAYGAVKAQLSPVKRFDDEALFAWADCAREAQDTLFRFFANHEDALWNESRSGLDPIMAELQNFVGTVRGALQERSRKGLVADDRRMLEAMTTFALTWDINTLCNALANDTVPSTQKETLQTLVSHLEPLWLSLESPHKDFLNRLKCLREERILENPESAKVALAAHAQYAAWAAFNFTKENGKRALEAMKSAIANIEFLLAQGDLSDEARESFEQRLTELQKDLESVKKFGLGITAFLQGVENAFPEARQADAKTALEAAFHAQREGLHVRGRVLQEGDMFLSISNVGAGDLIALAANQPGFGAHSGVLARDESEGWPVYFTAEWGGQLSLSSALQGPHLQDSIWVRPEFEPRAGFVARAIANLKRNPRHSFDTLMKEGILGRTGEISLYCAEFVHFAFENEVDATSSVRHQSPFHDEIARVSGLGATARANFVDLGFDPDGRYFNPGGLLFSKLTRPLFSTFNESTGFFGGGDPNAPEALAWKHMEALSARYNLRFASTFQQFPLKPISLAERMALETAVTLQNVAGVVSQWKRNKQSTGGDDSTTPIGDGNAGGGVELPPGRARYGMMKLANALSGLFKLVDSTVALAPKDAAWREKADHAFETTHLPRMLQLFAVDSKCPSQPSLSASENSL